jgi:hypothetical protein
VGGQARCCCPMSVRGTSEEDGVQGSGLTEAPSNVRQPPLLWVCRAVEVDRAEGGELSADGARARGGGSQGWGGGGGGCAGFCRVIPGLLPGEWVHRYVVGYPEARMRGHVRPEVHPFNGSLGDPHHSLLKGFGRGGCDCEAGPVVSLVYECVQQRHALL